MTSPHMQGYPNNDYNTQGGAIFGGNIDAARDINITHITTLQPLARSIHHSLFTAPDLFKQVQRELSDLIVILETTEQNSAELQATSPRYSEICNDLKQCHDALLELRSIKDHFDSVGPTAQVTWERMGWCENELASIKARIESHSRTLNHLNTAAFISSQANTRRMLETFIRETRTGAQDRSEISCDSLNEDERRSWRMLRKELQSFGISPENFSRHRAMIISTLRSELGDTPVDISSFTGGNERESEFQPLHSLSQSSLGHGISRESSRDLPINNVEKKMDCDFCGSKWCSVNDVSSRHDLIKRTFLLLRPRFDEALLNELRSAILDTNY